jgi:hypothetical protein
VTTVLYIVSAVRLKEEVSNRLVAKEKSAIASFKLCADRIILDYFQQAANRPHSPRRFLMNNIYAVVYAFPSTHPSYKVHEAAKEHHPTSCKWEYQGAQLVLC